MAIIVDKLFIILNESGAEHGLIHVEDQKFLVAWVFTECNHFFGEAVQFRSLQLFAYTQQFDHLGINKFIQMCSLFFLILENADVFLVFLKLGI